jgi:NAD(P)-dependent dehydrogenase (short-subunit alcohol dehydrogenase family)
MVMAVPEKIRKKIIEDIPVGRLGIPKEVARVVSFLVEEDAWLHRRQRWPAYVLDQTSPGAGASMSLMEIE